MREQFVKEFVTKLANHIPDEALKVEIGRAHV